MLVEDDPNIADLVDLYLRNDGCDVYQAANGERALEVFDRRKPDLVILDIGLPGDLDGFEVCRSIREISDAPIIMLTARNDEIDRVVGFELGTDDYVTKPFSPRELVGRVKAILRRSKGPREKSIQVVQFGEVHIDIKRAEITSGDQVIATTAQEWALLIYLLENRGQVMSRRQILNGAWELDWIGDERTVDVHVRQLRKKIGPSFQLKTVRGIGYRLD
ncbi:MAG: DNA-binding response regulator [Actinobacteria bacterium]|nr:DNA-binding response regulator [Actinomycetota bacterium]